MMTSNVIEELRNAIGALSELSGTLRDDLIRNGFTRDEACKIVAVFISETINGQKRKEPY